MKKKYVVVCCELETKIKERPLSYHPMDMIVHDHDSASVVWERIRTVLITRGVNMEDVVIIAVITL